jgi:hypothetical protein
MPAPDYPPALLDHGTDRYLAGVKGSLGLAKSGGHKISVALGGGRIFRDTGVVCHVQAYFFLCRCNRRAFFLLCRLILAFLFFFTLDIFGVFPFVLQAVFIKVLI